LRAGAGAGAQGGRDDEALFAGRRLSWNPQDSVERR
jgi:hypothetical protein